MTGDTREATGVLWGGGEPDAAERPRGASHRFAFFGLCLFTTLLYVRPSDLLPHSLGLIELVVWSPVGLFPFQPHALPIAKVVAVVTLLAYVVSKVVKGERLTDWTV